LATPSTAYEAIFAQSDFVPPGHRKELARGLELFLQQEDEKALELLSCIIAPLLRHALEQDGAMPRAERPLSLKALISPASYWSTHLRELLPDGYLAEIEDLFVDTRRPSDVRSVELDRRAYSCWFVLHLSLLTILERWDAAELSFLSVMDEDSSILQSRPTAIRI
jgi:hypothetical protein